MPGSGEALSLIVPAFNEERRLPQLLGELRGPAESQVRSSGFRLLEAVIVDSVSTDRTDAILRQAASELSLVRPVSMDRPVRGKGAAVAAGVRAARGHFVLFVDVDLSAPLEELPKLARAIEAGADVAIGSRAADPKLRQGPARRLVMGRSFNALVRAMTGLPHRDTQCPFKLMRRSTAAALLEPQLVPRFAFDVELLMRARRARLEVAEVPVRFTHDEDSRLSPARSSIEMAIDVARLSYRLGRGRGP